MACGTLGGFLLTWPLGWLSDRLDRRFVIIGAAITATVTLLILVGVVPKQAPRWILYLCAAILGGTIVPTYSVVMAHVNDSVEKGEFAAASGGLLIVQGAGAVVGPLIAGVAMSFLQRGLSSTIIVAQILMAIFGVYRLRHPAPTGLRKGTFVVEPPIPVATTLRSADSRGASPVNTRS
jgi:MFS family permease